MSKSKLERQLEIIKDLHEPNTRRNICTRHSIDERTFRNYFNGGNVISINNVDFAYSIKELPENKDIYMNGSEEPVKQPIEERLFYKASEHPILLPLNMTEVYMLTNGLLDMLEKDTPIYNSYKNLANKIYSQLSPYAKKRLGDNRHCLEQLDRIVYESELELYDKSIPTKFMYAEKTNQRVKVIFEDDSEEYGYVSRSRDPITRKGKLILKNEKTKKEIDIDNKGIIKEIKIIE